MKVTGLSKARYPAMSLQAYVNALAITAEFRLLVALTRDPEHTSPAPVLCRLDTLDWQRFIALAEFHRVEGLVANALAANRSAAVPPDVETHFANRLRTSCLHGLASAKATIEVTRSLARHGIPTVLLKGLAVAYRYYREPHARQSIDIDLLVPERQVTDAQRVIEGLGYVQSHPTNGVPPTCHGTLRAIAKDVSYVHKTDGTRLELHWRLSRNPRLSDLSTEAFRWHSTTMSIGASELAVLGPAALLTFLTCHGARHAWFRLKWMADIDRMLTEMTEGQLQDAVELSAQNGTLHLLATSLRLRQILYGTRCPVSDDLSRNVDEGLLRGFLRAVLASPQPHDDVRLTNMGRTFRDLHFNMSLRKETAYKVTAMLDFAMDVRDIETLRLSRQWLWVYAIAGPVLAVGRILARERRSLLGLRPGTLKNNAADQLAAASPGLSARE